MPDLQKLQNSKERIMRIITSSGPSLPAKISRETGISPLFASAFLSELTSERKLRLSNMKVGSSPIYYMQGQEPDLERFVDYLNPKEREAFFMLKENKILLDEKQEPVIRVALRKISDFAHPINVRVNGEIKLFWKFFTLPEAELRELIENKISPNAKKAEPKKDEVKSEEKEEISKVVETPEEVIEKSPKTKKKVRTQEPNEFGLKVKNYLKAKDIEVLEEISDKKKEYVSKIRIDTPFGKQEFYLFAKDKKSISDTDITLAHQKAQGEKMPALLLAPGDLNKKALSHLETWRNLVKFEKIR